MGVSAPLSLPRYLIYGLEIPLPFMGDVASPPKTADQLDVVRRWFVAFSKDAILVHGKVHILLMVS